MGLLNSWHMHPNSKTLPLNFFISVHLQRVIIDASVRFFGFLLTSGDLAFSFLAIEMSNTMHTRMLLAEKGNVRF